MLKCPTCDKVYCAERVTSLGKDWYQPCLKCEKCGKTLTSRGHAEHEGKPYCNQSCYAAMFGPKGFGRGGPDSHTFK
ncbi:PREDICTED: cysteine-rich protein 1 [Colobus angolensis palliatus]|uniref:cysteine-rich protein 1 n=1 Tax=Colobus angolensis palliatus TaxID=336983 RepID=UPI0005F494E9|nr:PREDICTED: cysteine-rich protein 1 [Colobus angolensis palliatus]